MPLSQNLDNLNNGSSLHSVKIGTILDTNKNTEVGERICVWKMQEAS